MRKCNRINTDRSMMLSAVLLGTVVCPAAFAQEAIDKDAEDRRMIVVTARKQAEPLNKVAAPVSVLGGQSLATGGITTADQLAERFVGLTVLPNATGNLLFIRGVGGFTLTANAEPAIGWNYDGVFVARPMGTNGQMFDLERVELLKGPQGALHGRNATGGSVNLIPRRPEPGQTSAQASLSYGNFSSITAEAALNLHIGSNGALRVSSLFTDQDSYLEGLESGPSEFGLRVQLAGELNSAMSIRAAADYTHLGGVGLGTGYRGKFALNRATGAFDFVPSGLDPKLSTRSSEGQAFRETIFLPTLGRRLDALQSIPGQDHELYGAHAELKADLGFAELLVQPAWRFTDLDAVVAGPPFDYLHRETQEQSSLEARLSGKAGAVDWLVGAYLFGETVQVDYANNFSTSLVFSDQSYKTTSRAGFAQATWHLSERFRIGGGLRLTDERKRNTSAVTSFGLTCTQLLAGAPSCPTVPLLQLYDRIDAIPFAIPGPGQAPVPVLVNGAPTGATIGRSTALSNGTVSSTAITWRGTLELDVGSNGLLYASVANGYRPGGTNTATGFETYRPEQLIAYTLGGRWRSPRGLLSAAFEAFWWDYRDQHATSLQPDLSTPPRNVNITRNIGRSRIRGADLEIDFRPARLTNGFARIEYLHARYLDNVFPQVSPAGSPLTGCNWTRQGMTTVYTVDCTDQRPFMSPPWTVTFGMRQGFELDRVQVDIMARTKYVGAMMAGTAFLPQQRIPARWTSHAQIAFSDRARRLELAAFVHNIEGNRTPSFIIYHPVSNAMVASTTPPRTYGVRAVARF